MFDIQTSPGAGLPSDVFPPRVLGGIHRQTGLKLNSNVSGRMEIGKKRGKNVNGQQK